MMLASRGDIGFVPLEMSHYRVHAAGAWTRLSPLHRVALTVRMLRHVARLLPDEARERVERQESHLADWWSSEFVNNSSISIDTVVNELDGIATLDFPTTCLPGLFPWRAPEARPSFGTKSRRRLGKPRPRALTSPPQRRRGKPSDCLLRSKSNTPKSPN